MQTQKQVRKFFWQKNIPVFVTSIVLLAVFGLLLLTVGVNTIQASPLKRHAPALTSMVGHANLYPQGQCTWWANQRYYQLHGVFVPWTINSNAQDWVARAHDFGWRVSGKPHKGDILVLQSLVQGASALGHVAIVEKVLPNRHVIASSMNWGSRPWAVTTWQFTPGPGVAFVRR